MKENRTVFDIIIKRKDSGIRMVTTVLNGSVEREKRRGS